MEPVKVYYIEISPGRIFWFGDNLYFKGGDGTLLWDRKINRFSSTHCKFNDLDECLIVTDIDFFDICTDWVDRVEFRSIPIGGAFTDKRSREYFIKTSQYHATAFVDVDEDLGCYDDITEFEEGDPVFLTDISTLSTLENAE